MKPDADASGINPQGPSVALHGFCECICGFWDGDEESGIGNCPLKQDVDEGPALSQSSIGRPPLGIIGMPVGGISDGQEGGEGVGEGGRGGSEVEGQVSDGSLDFGGNGQEAGGERGAGRGCRRGLDHCDDAD